MSVVKPINSLCCKFTSVCFCWSTDEIMYYKRLVYVPGKISVYVPYLYFVYCSKRVIPGLNSPWKLPSYCQSKNNGEGDGGKYFSDNNSMGQCIGKHSQKHHEEPRKEEGWTVEISHISSFSGQLKFSSVKKKSTVVHCSKSNEPW